MRIYLTGATGVIGRRLIAPLIAAGHDVTALVRSAGRGEQLRAIGAALIHADLFDPNLLRRTMADHDTVINLATSIPPSSRAFFRRAWRANDRIRSIASGNLVDAALASGGRRFIQESFAPIYRDGGEGWLDEQAPVQPARYNRSVLDAEAAAERFMSSGRIGVVLRFAFFYGADSDFTVDAIRSVKRGWAPVIGSPGGYLSSISHDDAAAAVIAALSVPAGTYNVADDEPLRRRECYETLAAALGVAPPRFPPALLARLSGSVGETLSRSQRISNRKLKSESDWTPALPSLRRGWPVVVAELDRSAGAVPNARRS